ncbi:MAG: sigma 54-interacting transcriptional regulator [Planctomycetes bacterium]|nr:sigma 54-interacting transcriptional regulator [Planctomycetota bacterium]
MDLTTLHQIALAVAQVHPTKEVLDTIVSRLADQPGVALARIWLMGPGDLCATCPLRSSCPDQTRCLHLESSAGSSQVDGADYSGIEGRFSRIPIGWRKVGRIGSTGQAERLCLNEGREWVADPEWADAEGIQTFAGQPLMFRGEILGVLGLFYRAVIDVEQVGWLRTFADQAAVSLANAWAFEEVDCLRKQLELERDYLREEVTARSLGGIVGESLAIKKVLRQIEVVSPSDASVLVQGESGTGKELVAQAIHENSTRRKGSLVRVNCASIPRELFESEFFGHAQGSFTGASRDRAGRFQVADGGTLFLDEVGEIPLELQGKLLRVLQEGEYSRVGEDTTHRVDVRIVAATNRDLEADARAGRFREDLYYRLSVFPIRVPPLRERREDIAALAAHFVKVSGERLGIPNAQLRRVDARALSAYDWPGNVRELQNVIERALILSQGGKRLRFELPAQTSSAGAPTAPPPGEILTDAEIQAFARANLLTALERVNWKVSGEGGAAELLDLNPNTLASRMRSLKIKRPR